MEITVKIVMVLLLAMGFGWQAIKHSPAVPVIAAAVQLARRLGSINGEECMLKDCVSH